MTYLKHQLQLLHPKRNSLTLKCATLFRLGLSHLNKHKFKHTFQGTLNPSCVCVFETKTAAHYLLLRTTYQNEKYLSS